jgi:hypothetical protein
VVAEPGGRIARRLALGQACRHALDHAIHARLKEERTRKPVCMCVVCVSCVSCVSCVLCVSCVCVCVCVVCRVCVIKEST